MARHRDIHNQHRLLERTEEWLRGGNATPADPPSVVAAKMQIVEDLPKPNGLGPEAAKAKVQELQALKDRALSLRRQYPDMKDIPTEVSKQQRKSLIQSYEQEKTATGPSRELWGGSSGAHKSAKPKKYEAKKGKKKGSAQLKANFPTSSGTVPTNGSEPDIKSISAANLPPRPAPKEQKRAARRDPRKKQHTTSQNPNVNNQPSNKMAPLSDARRAEVARNLKGLTHNDPINVD